MRSSSKFCRGQIWHWSDPLYAAKQGMDVPGGEMTMRYSRYVLIIQNTETIDGYSAIVLPLSSKSKSKLEIEIEISHFQSSCSSYVKIGKMMPVALTQLDDYVCTVSDEVMEIIEAELIYYLAPVSWFTSTGLPEGLRKPFDIVREILAEEPEVETPIEESITETPVKEATKMKKKFNQASRNWDDQDKMKFMQYREAHTLQETAEEFNISTTSVSRYQKKFADLLKQPKPSKPHKVREETPAHTLQETASQISNYILKDLRNQDVYSYQKEYSTSTDGFIPDKREFYYKLSASLYYSFIEMLGLKEISPGKLSEENCETAIKDDTFKIMEKIAKIMKTGASPLQLRSKVLRKEGINPNWINYLIPQLTRRLEISAEGIGNIAGLVRGTYCTE